MRLLITQLSPDPFSLVKGEVWETDFLLADHAALYAVLLLCAFLSPRAKGQEFVTIFEVRQNNI